MKYPVNFRFVYVMNIKVICFLSLLFFGIVGNGFSQEKSSTPFEILRGDYEYDIPTETITLRPKGEERPSVIIGDRSITADTIIYNQIEQTIHASGDVRLWDQGSILRGEHLVFYIEKNQGILEEVKEAELAEGVFFKGDSVTYKRRPAKRPAGATEAEMIPEYTVRKGQLTGSDWPVPTYYFGFDKVVVVPNVRFWANNIVMNVQSYPMFYLPFFTQSLGQSKVAYYFDFAHYSRLGYAAFNRLNIVPGEPGEYEFDFYGDYFTDVGVGAGGKFQFDVKGGEYSPKGEIYGWHIAQDGADNDNIYEDEDRYIVSGEYAQDLPYDMRISGRAHKLSDSEYLWDYHGPERVRESDPDAIQRDSVSHIDLVKRWDDQSMRLTAAQRFDSFYYNGLPYVERRPQVHFEHYPTNLFDSNVYTNLQLDFGRYRREEGYTIPIKNGIQDRIIQNTLFIDEVDRYDANLKFAYPIRLPSRWTFKPWVGYRGTEYSDPERTLDDRQNTYNFDSVTRSMPQGGLEISNRSTAEFEPFLDRYDRMRIVVEPVFGYEYYHPDNALEEEVMNSVIPGARDIRFPYIDPADDVRYQMHRVSALLRTRIQGKDQGGVSSDFFRFTTGLAYDYMPDDNLLYDNFEFSDDFANHTDYRYSDWIEEFDIYPFPWFSVGNTLRYDVDDSEVRSSYYYAQISPLSRLHFTMGYNTYLFPNLNPLTERDEQEDAAIQMLYDVSNKWQVFSGLWFDHRR